MADRDTLSAPLRRLNGFDTRSVGLLLDFHDFREGARTGRLPARENAALRAELLSLVDDPRRGHVAVAERNGRIIAGHIARHEGGTLKVLVLARSPVRDDLVTENAYIAALERLRGTDGIMSIDLATAGAKLPHSTQRSVTPRARLSSIRWRIQRRVWFDGELRLFRRPIEDVRRDESVAPMEKNSIADFLKYEVGSRDGMSRREFLHMQLERLEDGWTAYSVADETRLLNSRWAVRRIGRLPLDPIYDIPLPEDSVYFADVFTDPTARGKGLQLRGSRFAAHDAAGLPGVRWVIGSALPSNAASQRNVDRAGFRHFMTVFTRRRFGRQRRWRVEV